eukprot:tig00000073_g1713.t1
MASSGQLSDSERLDRIRGSLMGLAVVDALGTTLEFKPPGSFKKHTDITGGGPFGLKPGQWTDDTSMALCMAASLCEKQAYDPVDTIARYKMWFAQGYMSSTGRCFDIGNATRAALARYHGGADPYCGSTDPKTAGNGSIMRLCPVVLAFSTCPELAVELAGDSSATTHAAEAAVDGCRLMAAAMLAGLAGRPKADALKPAEAFPAPGYWARRPLRDPGLVALAAGSFASQAEPPRSTGYVVQTLLCAMWALHTTDNFRDGAIAVVNLGGDADTAGAVYGQIAGALYGLKGIPPEWLAKVHAREMILDLADRLFELSRPARLHRAVSDLAPRRLFLQHQVDLAQTAAQLAAAAGSDGAQK